MRLKIPNEITPELAEETEIHIGDGSMNFYKNKRYAPRQKKNLYKI